MGRTAACGGVVQCNIRFRGGSARQREEEVAGLVSWSSSVSRSLSWTVPVSQEGVHLNG